LLGVLLSAGCQMIWELVDAQLLRRLLLLVDHLPHLPWLWMRNELLSLLLVMLRLLNLL
jgi:hypothetical protein